MNGDKNEYIKTGVRSERVNIKKLGTIQIKFEF